MPAGFSPKLFLTRGPAEHGHTASGQTAPSPALLGTTPGRTKDFQGRMWPRGGVGAEPESVRGTKGRSTRELSTSRLREALKIKRKAARINWVLRESATFFHPSLPQCGHQGPKAPSMSVYLFGQSSQSARGRRVWGVGKVRLSPPRCVALRSSQTLSGPQFAGRRRGVMTSSQGGGEGLMGELLRPQKQKAGTTP